MIYQKDWLMRQIENMIAAIMHFLFQTTPAQIEISEDEKELKAHIDHSLSKGDICKTEDWLYENIDMSDIMWLRLAVHFYSEVNKYSDEYLNVHNFARDEVSSGLLDICQQFGHGDIL